MPQKDIKLVPAFPTGWISLVVGFSAPVATGSLLFVQYMNKVLHTATDSTTTVLFFDGIGTQKTIAAFGVLFFEVVHIIGVKPAAISRIS